MYFTILKDETLLLTGSGAGDINIYKLQNNKTLELISVRLYNIKYRL